MKTDFKRKFLGGVKAGKKNCRASSENFGQNRNQYHPNELNQNDGKIIWRFLYDILPAFH